MPSIEEPVNRRHWRSLNELADTPEFRRLVEREFPSQASELKDSHSRRGFLQLMGASLSLAGMAGCRWPKQNILPFAHRPEDRIPGVPKQYATAMELRGGAQGLLVTSYDGRPIKVEGNPSHPINAGKADLFAQASVLELYDPDRSREVIHSTGGQRFGADWSAFEAFAGAHFSDLKARGGDGLCVLAQPGSSPSLAEMRARLLLGLAGARWFEWEPVSHDTERLGAVLALGRPYRTQASPAAAEVLVSLDSDFLFEHPASLRYAREFAAGRKGENGRMNRLYVIESGYSITGAAADHRHALPSSGIPVVAGILAARVFELLGSSLPADLAGMGDALASFQDHPYTPPFVAKIAADLVGHRGSGLLFAGPRQPAEVHAITHLLNAALGNTGRTVFYSATATGTAEGENERPTGTIKDLIERMRSGSVDTLIVLGGNPAFDAPADLDFAGALAKVAHRIHLGLHRDETAQAVLGAGRSASGEGWHLPRAHDLESWSDARSWDGTWSVVQPLIAPLYDGRTPAEILAVCANDPVRQGYDIVRRTAAPLAGSGDFESFWRTALSNGIIGGTEFSKEAAPIQSRSLAAALATYRPTVPPLGRDNLEIVFTPDSGVHDGRYANNGWLQEIPRVLTKITWDNALILGPGTAAALGVKADDLVTLRYRGRELKMPVYVLPGQAPYSATVHLGGGRTAAGRVGKGAGFNVYALRTGEALGFDTGLTVTPTGRVYKLACTQDHHAIDTVGRKGMEQRIGELVRTGTLAEFVKKPDFAKTTDAVVPLWKQHTYEGHRWGMVIDLSTCVACNACVAACTAENNVPIVGKKRVLQGREMQWIRIDRYFSGDPETAEVSHEPMACVQCENAPCEEVCPVAATMHDSEGLNVQVYNRCIGTRYCSNNCPYKVRRFNFFNYRKGLSPTEKMAYNPEVTVRSRGVMEKCTYCVQRIEAVKIAAKNERRPIRDGEITPACAQTCPTEAIVFGDLSDPGSRVARLREGPRSYGVLGELGVKPRTHHLVRLRNPLAGAGRTAGEDHGA